MPAVSTKPGLRHRVDRFRRDESAAGARVAAELLGARCVGVSQLVCGSRFWLPPLGLGPPRGGATRLGPLSLARLDRLGPLPSHGGGLAVARAALDVARIPLSKGSVMDRRNSLVCKRRAPSLLASWHVMRTSHT